MTPAKNHRIENAAGNETAAYTFFYTRFFNIKRENISENISVEMNTQTGKYFSGRGVCCAWHKCSSLVSIIAGIIKLIILDTQSTRQNN